MEQTDISHNHRKTSEASYKHVLKYTGVFGGVQGLKMLVAVVRTKLTSIFLGGTGYGLITIYNSISEFIVSSSNLGIPLNATRQTSELYAEGTDSQVEQQISVIRTWVLWTVLLSVLICTLLSPLVSYIFFDKQASHFLEVMMIIPIVACFLVAEGECAILKGLRKLKTVALIEIIVVFSTLVLTIPFYYFLGIRGIILGLTCSGLSSVVAHFYFSLKLYSYRVRPFDMKTFRMGLPMIRVGIPYVLAGMVNSALNMAVAALIVMLGSQADVGYYRAGFMLMVGYAGIAFVALDADYYPRLSGVQHHIDKMNNTINRQIDVCVMLLAPFLILYITLMPFLIPLLYETEFMVVLNMTICASFYIFLRAIMLPIAYIALAKGHSVIHLIVEVFSALVYGLLIWWLYFGYGLTGAGIALSLWALYDLFAVMLVYGYKYGCRINRKTATHSIFQFICLLIATLVCLQHNEMLKYTVTSIMFLISFLFSIKMFLNQPLHFLNKYIKR